MAPPNLTPDNTPLGAVLDRLNDAPGVHRTVYLVNLFPNKADIPTNMAEIAARMKNLQFANKSLEDTKLLHRFNEVAALMEALETLSEGNPLKDHEAYRAVKARGYVHFNLHHLRRIHHKNDIGHPVPIGSQYSAQNFWVPTLPFQPWCVDRIDMTGVWMAVVLIRVRYLPHTLSAGHGTARHGRGP
jgi:hypothetical protein